MDFETFTGDRKTILAVVRSLEIIGEAARNVPDDLQQRLPDVTWQDMVAKRNMLIHSYVDVDLEVMWRTTQEDLPPLRHSVRRFVADL